MTVFTRQADYGFVNMIDGLTSDNYFLGTSSRIPHSGKIRKARGHVGRESFWFPDGKALVGCCCRSEFSRLTPRRDYTPIRYRCHWRWLSAKRKLDILRPRSRTCNHSYTLHSPSFFPIHLEIHSRSSPIFLSVFFFSNSAESFRSCRRITENTISSASLTGAQTPRYLFSISRIFLLAHPLVTFALLHIICSC